jgi:positive regulator of sigma E activity
MIQDQCVDGSIIQKNEERFLIALNSENSCKACGMKNVCSNKTIEFEKRQFPELNIKIGQKVRVEFEKVIQSSFIIYMIPILFFFAGIIISLYFFKITNELYQFLWALGFTGISFLIINYLSAILSKSTYKVNIKPFN